jgi:prepilin-type N-terminal cleavage/methylation domain-containing protein
MCEPSRRVQGGLTLIEVLLVIAIVALISPILLPRLIIAKAKHAPIGCENRLKQIGLSFQQRALDKGNNFPMQVSVTNGGTMELISSGNVFVNVLLLSNELNTPKILWCRDDTTRPQAASFATDFSVANISYFVGVHATKTSPQMILSGDDNLAVDGVPVKRGLLTLSANSQMALTAARHKRRAMSS